MPGTLTVRPLILPLAGMAVLAAAPTVLPGSLLIVLHLTFIFTIFAASWDLLYGYTGQVSLGHGFPFGLGGYFAVLLVILLGAPPWISLPVASATAAAASLLLALPSLRLKGMYLAITTLAMAYIAGIVALILTTEEGYPGFLTSWPYPMERFFNGEPLANYYLGLLLMAGSLFILRRIGGSRMGLRFLAIREDVTVAQSLGVDVTRHKLTAFFASSFFAGLAGAYYSLFLGHVDYTFFDLSVFFTAAAIVVVGGVGTIVGAFFGVLVLEGISLYLGSLGAYRLMIFGALIVVSMRYMPEGILGSLRMLGRIRRRKR